MDKRDDKLKEVKISYEKQLLNLRPELKNLKNAHKEHAKAMRKSVSGGGIRKKQEVWGV